MTDSHEPRTELTVEIVRIDGKYREMFDAAAVRERLAEARAEAAPEREGLDVERLGRAIVEHRTKFWANEPCVAECARDIAPIYARLAPTSPSSEETA